ncbi:hypothetical protein QQM41_11870 [Acetobacter sp. AC2005]|uniref:hypothetical protein n=1 Tax=Acetobacter sp. AC2005 TaxID=3134142 RepID=UPI00036E4642|nr:hypothetical protein DB34_11410 [Acetobacter pasteurianus]
MNKYRKPSPVSVQMHIRVKPEIKLWLEKRAMWSVNTLNAEVAKILEEKMAAEPIAKQFSAATSSK